MGRKKSKPAENIPPLRLEWRSPADLAENPKNWRRHPESQIAALTDVVSEVGWAGACLFNELTGRLIDGHARRKVALAQGTDKVPVLIGSWDEATEAKILATLDPLAAMAETDSAALEELLKSVATDSPAIEQMLQELSEAAEAELPVAGAGGDEFDAASVESGPTRTAVGDVWVIGGKHRLLVGDCTDPANVERLMGGASLALVVTSPPYNQHIDKFRPSGMHKEGDWVSKVERLAYADSMSEPDYQSWQRTLLDVWHAAMMDGGSMFYNHKHRYRDKRVVSPLEWLPGPFSWRQEIIWSRPGSVTQNARMFLPSDERIYWLYKGDNFYFNDTTEHKTWSSVWRIGLEANADHAVAYPLDLPSRPIAACSKTGDVIADPFLGSGTTLIAAHRLGRICYGCEIEPKYADVILKRAEAEGLTVEKAE